jgi:PAS domain S-box-containing protein
MVWQSTPWADPLLVSTVVSASLAVFGLLYVGLIRRDRRVVAFVSLMIAAALWTLGYSFQFASAGLAGKFRWATVATIGEAIVPVAWFTFAAAYAGRDRWLDWDRLGVLWAVPALTVGLAVSNGSHGLVWGGSTLSTAPDGAYLVLERAAGPWLWIHGGYSYLVAFAGIVVLIGLIERSRHVYRGQAAVLFAGILITAGAHLLSILGVGPAAVVDLTAPSLSVLGIAFAVGIFRYRMFDLVPVARASIVENMGEGYVLLDDTGDVVDLNAAARSLLGGDDGRLIGRDARKSFDEDLSVLEAFDGDPVTETITIREPPDQRYIQLSVSSVEADRVRGTLVRIRDVTDRIRLERRFRTLIERSSDIVFVLDDRGIIEYVSPSVSRVLGYRPEELTGNVAFEELIVEDDATTRDDHTGTSTAAADPPSDSAAETWHRILDGRGTTTADSDTTRFEVRVEGGSGSTRFIEAIARYLVDDPAVEGIVINARDVTERKERELELQRTNERLDRFASVVSHDLRNPLNTASGYLSIARDSGEAEYFEKVAGAHDRMESMIEELLTMARADTAAEETEPVVVASLVADTWGTAETDGATLRTALPEGWIVEANPNLLRNVFENLFRNTVDHNDPPLTVTVGALANASGTPDGFYVEDDGRGIPPDERDQVFDHGYTTSQDGTGFGLSIVREFVEAHGWAVTATGGDDGGARFEIRGVERPEHLAAASKEVDESSEPERSNESPAPGRVEGSPGPEGERRGGPGAAGPGREQ